MGATAPRATNVRTTTRARKRVGFTVTINTVLRRKNREK